MLMTKALSMSYQKSWKEGSTESNSPGVFLCLRIPHTNSRKCKKKGVKNDKRI